jgi:hypothetical protein
MREARGKLRLCSQARVLGVAFFDFKHGQTGVAPNAIELHPILGFACLSRRAPQLYGALTARPPVANLHGVVSQ